MHSNKIEPHINNPANNIVSSSSGIKAVLDQALQSYDRLPMLEIIFEKFTRQLATAFRNLTSEPVDIEVIECNSLRFGGYFKNIKSSSSITVFQAVEWENLGLIVFDNNLIFSFVDILLGGKKNVNQSNKASSGRILTSIEQGLSRQIAEVMLNELSLAFEPVTPITFAFERLESNRNFAAIARPGDAIIVLKINVEIDNRSDKIDLVIPYKTIEPIKEQMQQVFLGDKFGNDAAWEEQMVRAIYTVDFSLEAVITNKPMSLSEVMTLKVGDTIVMEHKHDKDITVRCGNVDIFKGQIGKVENKVAVNLKHVIED